jgi:hypothetical protein
MVPAGLEECSVAQPTPAVNLGFLTVLHEASGYLGGYLVTNLWGRPLEFRLTSAVQPNRVQQVLYGGSLRPYIYADLIATTLVERTAAAAQLIVTDQEPVLDLRHKVDVPVVWLPSADLPGRDEPGSLAAEAIRPGRIAGALIRPARNGQGPIYGHPAFPADALAVRALLDRLDGGLDLGEPFARIREAIAEARKIGMAR